MTLGLYLHIPFCRSRCPYCNFISLEDPDARTRERFFRDLRLEISRVRQRSGAFRFDTIYLGGGTPSVLDPAEVVGLLETIRTDFDVAPGAEITCEWNPGDREEKKLSILKGAGVNRISLGAQSFHDGLLSRLGRRHSSADILKTFEGLRAAGIGNISLDLMLRIPGQTFEDFQHSLERCVKLGAEQVSLYDLEVHPGTQFGRLRSRGELALPGEAEHALMYQAAGKVLEWAGYEHYEISNFAKPGFASRHNLIYWRNQEYLGLGPGAFSYREGVRSQFAKDIPRYLEKCEAGDWRNDEEDVLSEAEKETETFAMGLRLKAGITPGDFPAIYPALAPRIGVLTEEGLLEQKDGKVRLTARGQFLSEDIFGFLLNQEERTLPGRPRDV